VPGLPWVLPAIKTYFKGWLLKLVWTLCIGNTLVHQNIRVTKSLILQLWSIFLKLWSSGFLHPSAIFHLGILLNFALSTFHPWNIL
jgi:hypothetical protein